MKLFLAMLAVSIILLFVVLVLLSPDAITALLVLSGNTGGTPRLTAIVALAPILAILLAVILTKIFKKLHQLDKKKQRPKSTPPSNEGFS
ncbi:hypothetical protein [Caldimonas mangrovi]|nr:hypothetical protein [Caldimonas mangrovi]